MDDARVTTAEAAQRWADTWQRAWRDHDVDAVLGLYSERAHFRSAPFREAHLGRDGVRAYVEWAFADEDPGADVRFGTPFVTGDRAVVEYWACVTVGGTRQTIAGVSLLRFGYDGLVDEQRDYWHSGEGRLRPSPEWGG